MRIGVFDSGAGGLAVLRAIRRALPQYDYLYLGDTARVPYGNRSQEAVRRFTLEAVDFLFGQGCQLIILACNTASAEALSFVQQVYLPARYPERRVLGMVVPTVEAVREAGFGRVGVLATASTVASGSYPREMRKYAPGVEVTQQAAPLLVPLIENEGQAWVEPILKQYLEGLGEVEAVILGCTHYCLIKQQVASLLAGRAQVISQDEVVPGKLATYLARHPELERGLSRRGECRLMVTDRSEGLAKLVAWLFPEAGPLELVTIEPLSGSGH